MSYLCRVVQDKLSDVVPRLDDRPFGCVLVADTIVVVDGEILGKPSDEVQACSMLRRLSGRGHEVLTRFAIALPARPSHPVCQTTVQTLVRFRHLSDSEVMRYVATGEGLDKAGAYAVQGMGAFAVERIEGSYSNVVGLPACEVVEALQRTGLLHSYP